MLSKLSYFVIEMRRAFIELESRYDGKTCNNLQQLSL